AAEGLDHDPAIGLLVVRRAYLPDFAVQPELRAGKRKRGTPLAGAGLRRQAPHTGPGVVVRLRHSGIRLVRTRWGNALVLVVDTGWCLQRFLQPIRAIPRAGPPQLVHVEHGAGDVEVLLSTYLLPDQVHRKQRGEVIRPNRLQGAWMKWRR